MFPIIYPCNFGKNATTGSKDIVQTRKRHRIFSFSTAVTLKIRSRSPKSNQFFVMSQLYINANLLRIQPLVQKILCRQESVMPMPMPKPAGSAPKTIFPPHRRCTVTGHKIFLNFPRKQALTFHANCLLQFA